MIRHGSNLNQLAQPCKHLHPLKKKGKMVPQMSDLAQTLFLEGEGVKHLNVLELYEIQLNGTIKI